jgi:hypothetical protein
VLNTYNVELYERFRAAGYDLTEGHEMGSILGHGTSNRPFLGFLKRYRGEDAMLPKNDLRHPGGLQPHAERSGQGRRVLRGRVSSWTRWTLRSAGVVIERPSSSTVGRVNDDR